MMPDFLPSFHSLQGQYNSRQITTGRNRSIAPGIWNNITQNAKSIEQQVRFNVGVATHGARCAALKTDIQNKNLSEV